MVDINTSINVNHHFFLSCPNLAFKAVLNYLLVTITLNLSISFRLALLYYYFYLRALLVWLKVATTFSFLIYFFNRDDFNPLSTLIFYSVRDKWLIGMTYLVTSFSTPSTNTLLKFNTSRITTNSFSLTPSLIYATLPISTNLVKPIKISI